MQAFIYGLLRARQSCMGHRFDPWSGKIPCGHSQKTNKCLFLFPLFPCFSDFSPSSLLEPTLISCLSSLLCQTVLLKVTEKLHVCSGSGCFSVLSLGKPDAFDRLISLKHLFHLFPGYHTNLVFFLPLIDHSTSSIEENGGLVLGPLLIFLCSKTLEKCSRILVINTVYNNSKIDPSSSVSPLTYFLTALLRCNSHATPITDFQCTIQWFLIY